MAVVNDAVIFGEKYLGSIWDEEEQALITRNAVALLHRSHHLCESPIEVMMLAGLIGVNFGYCAAPNEVVSLEELDGIKATDRNTHIIVPQMKVEQFSYRTDFFVSLFTNGHRRIGLFIECDGHDFHERTKEQAARDRKRDRDLQSLGINILRFTGSELHRDFDESMTQIDSFGCDLIEREWARSGFEVPGFAFRNEKSAVGKLIDG